MQKIYKIVKYTKYVYIQRNKNIVQYRKFEKKFIEKNK